MDNDDASDDEDMFNGIEGGYHTILQELLEEFLLIEITHNTSKTATNAFWRASEKGFYKLQQAKNLQGITKSTPQFVHLRRKMYKDLPKVNMEIAYENKETKEITTVNTEITPKSQFPPDQYVKLYELASVDVSL